MKITIIDEDSGSEVTTTEKDFIRALEVEVKSMISEQCFDKDGKFSKCRSPRVYSRSKNHRSVRSKSSVAKKGYYTKRSNVRSKYGMPKTCGRIDIDGNEIPISKRRSCKDFPNRYPSDIDEGADRTEGYEKVCVSLGYVKKNEAFRQALIAISALEKASKGKV
jgi:hypothetical protein